MNIIESYKLQTDKADGGFNINNSAIDNYIISKVNNRDRYILNGGGYTEFIQAATDDIARIGLEKLQAALSSVYN